MPISEKVLAPRTFVVQHPSLLLSERASRIRRLASFLGNSLLFLVTSSSAIAVLFIFLFIFRDAIPFFQEKGFAEFFTGREWYPSATPSHFGAFPIFYGSLMVTLGAILVAVPLGIAAAVCLSDLLPFSIRQTVKPVIEILAAIPSVAYGFFALVLFAPLLQDQGGRVLSLASWIVGGPILVLGAFVLSDIVSGRMPERHHRTSRIALLLAFGGAAVSLLWILSSHLSGIRISSGTNALNVSIILGIMAIPTIVSVSEDALQAVGRELREGSYALGATRAGNDRQNHYSRRGQRHLRGGDSGSDAGHWRNHGGLDGLGQRGTGPFSLLQFPGADSNSDCDYRRGHGRGGSGHRFGPIPCAVCHGLEFAGHFADL